MIQRTLIRTKVYEKSLSDLPRDANIQDIENQVAADPLYWPVIPGTGGLRKARFQAGSHGKRGGGRLIYVYVTVQETLYFLKAYRKNEQLDFKSF